MAHYAELDGVNGLAICNDALSLPPDFELHYEIFVLSNGTEDYIAAPFNGRGIGFWSSFVAIYASTQQVYFSYPASGRPAIGDRVSLRLTSTDNGNGTFTIRCYMSVNAEAEVQLNKAVGNDIFSQPLSPRPMEWGRRPNTIFRKVGVIRTRYYESGVIQNDWDFNQSSGNVAPDLVGGNDATLSGGFSWIYYDNGGSEPVAQTITTITAESNHEASVVTLAQSVSLNVSVCEHRTAAEVLNAFVFQLASTLLADEIHEGSLLSIEQTAAQGIELVSSEQITQAQNLTATQRSILSSIIAEQLNDATTSTLTNVQAITCALVEQVHEAAPLSLNQFTGQLVTLLVAEQSNDAQTFLISNVNALDVISTEQISQASLQSINQHHQIEIITAEQLTEAQIINLLSNGDNTDLSGLSLQPITSIYSITPITKRYSFKKV